MMNSIVLGALMLAVAAPVYAVNKCVGPDGKAVFQDTPCAGKGERIDVRPSAGTIAAKPPASAASGAAKPLTEAQRIEGVVAFSQRDRRKRDLRERLLPEAEATLKNHRATCDHKQKELAASQYAYTQNLYGKTHAAQIASEMAANAALCDTKDRELKEKLDTLVAECTTLMCK